MRNIKIAKELIRIAKNIIADDANDHKVDEELFQAENIDNAVEIIKTKVSQYVKKDVIDDGFYDKNGYVPDMYDIKTLLANDLEFDGLGINADLSDDFTFKEENDVDIYVNFTCFYTNENNDTFYMKGRYGCIRHLDKKTYDIYFNIQKDNTKEHVEEEKISMTADKPGKYEKFTGTINFKGVSGKVKEATFTLNEEGYDITWENGIWQSGTWINGKWQDGTWIYGNWKDGKWKKGKDDFGKYHRLPPNNWEQQYIYFTGRLNYMGTVANVKNATFKTFGTSGKIIWTAGTLQSGTWNSTNGVWEDGTWKSGTWNGGTWKDGTWIKGTWNGGTWIKGYDQFSIKQFDSPDTWGTEDELGKYDKALYGVGVYQNFTGTIEFGDIKSTVENATFELLDTEKGKTIVWYYGIWKRGTWGDGVWNQGTWESGTWNQGIWQDGTWIKGTWKGGVWENGKDDKGIIHTTGDSPDKWKFKEETAYKEGEYKEFTGKINW